MPIYSNRPRGPAGGDLSGSYPDPQVINLSGSATGSFSGSFIGDGGNLSYLDTIDSIAIDLNEYSIGPFAQSAQDGRTAGSKDFWNTSYACMTASVVEVIGGTTSTIGYQGGRVIRLDHVSGTSNDGNITHFLTPRLQKSVGRQGVELNSGSYIGGDAFRVSFNFRTVSDTPVTLSNMTFEMWGKNRMSWLGIYEGSTWESGHNNSLRLAYTGFPVGGAEYDSYHDDFAGIDLAWGTWYKVEQTYFINKEAGKNIVNVKVYNIGGDLLWENTASDWENYYLYDAEQISNGNLASAVDAVQFKLTDSPDGPQFYLDQIEYSVFKQTQFLSTNQTLTGSFTGSFSGDGSSLTGLPSASIDHVIFVTKGGDDTTGNGSITKPFLTVQAAIDYASSSYSNFSEGVQIEIAPGLYNENVTLTRHNTYIVSSLKKAEQRSVTIKGNFTINCTAAAQKFNHIVGLDGIFFDNSEDATSPTLLLTGSATSGHLTYLKGCYVAQNSSGSNANAFKTSGLRFSNNFSGSKITAQNTTFLAQKAGADVVSLDGGDYKFDSCEVYCNVTGSSTTGSGVKIVGETALLMDRAIIEIYTNGYAVSNASTKASGTICFISNASLTSAGTGSVGIVSSSTDIVLWNDIFTGYNVTFANYKINGTAGKLAYFSHLTAPVPITATGITLFPLTETHGTIVAASVTSSLGFSGSLSSSYLVGTIPVSKGGTGATTFTSASLLVGNTTGAFGTISPTPISGSLLISNGTTWTSISSGSIGGVGVTGGAANYIPLWNGASSLTTSSISQSLAGNIGISRETNSNFKLAVTGTTYSDTFQTIELKLNGIDDKASTPYVFSGTIGQNVADTNYQSYVELRSLTDGAGKSAKLVLSSSNANNNSGSIEFRTNDIVYANKQTVAVSTDITLTPQYPFIVVTPSVSGRVVTLDRNSKYAIGTRITIVNGSTANSIAIVGGSGIGKVIPIETASDFILCSEFDRAWVPIS